MIPDMVYIGKKHTFDVISLKKAAGFNGSPHLWPIDYYRRAVTGKMLPYWAPDQTVLLRYPPEKHTLM